MRITYDPEADAAHIYLVEIGWGGVARGDLCDVETKEGAILVDFDHDDHLVAIEILTASKILPASVLEAAERELRP